MIPAEISQSLTCRAGGSFCPPGQSRDLLRNSSVPPWLQFCRKGEATTALQGTRQEQSVKLLLLLGESGVGLASVCAGRDRHSFPGKGLHPPCWELFLADSSSMGLCQQKSPKERSVLSVGGEISTRACFQLAEAATPTRHAPETALHIHKDTDLREQLSPAQNLLILAVRCLSVVLRRLCLPHV